MKNKYEVRGDIVVIFLKRRNGEVLETFIDLQDFERVNSFPNTWYSWKCPKWGHIYVRGGTSYKNKKQETVYLHRWIFGDVPQGKVIDHINHDTLDNRRSTNLRVATNAQNGHNRIGANRNNKSSGIRGITWKRREQKWCASVIVDGKFNYVGMYEDLEEAKKALNEYRKIKTPYSNFV